MIRNYTLIAVLFLGMGVCVGVIGFDASPVIEEENIITKLDEKIKDKVEFLSVNQTKSMLLVYSYCLNYEEYEKRVTIQIPEMSKYDCLLQIEEFLDGI